MTSQQCSKTIDVVHSKHVYTEYLVNTLKLILKQTLFTDTVIVNDKMHRYCLKEMKDE